MGASSESIRSFQMVTNSSTTGGSNFSDMKKSAFQEQIMCLLIQRDTLDGQVEGLVSKLCVEFGEEFKMEDEE